MKKTLVILAILTVVCCAISIIINQNKEVTNEEPTASSVTQATTTTQAEIPEEINAKITISSDKYFDLVNATIKSCIEPEGYIVSSTSTLRMPYYHVDCTAKNIDTTNFKADALRIVENIYNRLLLHEYQRRSIFFASHEIISITLIVITNGKTTHGLTIQFDLTDIDRSKPFLENLITPITP